MATTFASKSSSISAFGKARSTVEGHPLSTEEVQVIDRYLRWNDLSAGKPLVEGTAED